MQVWIDASYEADVMARANVTYTVGRESNATYNESLAGRLPIPPPWGCAANWNLGNNVSGINASTGALLPMVQVRGRVVLHIDVRGCVGLRNDVRGRVRLCVGSKHC